MSSEANNLELPKRKRNPDDGELDITPMIDVTFLLLAFFVVMSKMDPQAAVPLPKASYGDSVPDKNCVTLVLVVPEAGVGYSVFKGRSMSDDSKVLDGEEEDQIADIGEFVESEFSQFPTKTAVLIKASGEVSTRAVELVKRGIARSDLAKTKDLFVGVEEEQ